MRPFRACSATGAGRATLFEAIRSALVAIARCQPAAALLDDLHWADDTTVDMHARHILDKLGCRSRAEATYKAGQLGLLDEERDA